MLHILDLNCLCECICVFLCVGNYVRWMESVFFK